MSRIFHWFRLDRIKGRVLAFALVATLIPSLTLGWQSYVLNKRFITEKISEEVRNATLHTARELDLWLKERIYEMRVFTSSYEVVENLEKIRAPGPAGRSEAQGRLTQYLQSVHDKFTDYEELAVISRAGEVLSTSAEQAGASSLPPDWLARAEADAVIVGDIEWDQARGRPTLKIVVPVRAANRQLLGAMAGAVNLGGIEKVLSRFAFGQTGKAYLVRPDGTVISASQPAPFPSTRLAAPTVRALFEREETSMEYADYRGRAVRGALKRLPRLGGWGVVADIGRDEAYAQTDHIWNNTLLVVAALLAGIGIIAYILGMTIVRPLNRLTAGASRVSAGDLDVRLPVGDHGEVGYLTEVFNHMVTRLRQGRDELAAINAALSEKNRELEALSITDGLTGLYNHKHLLEVLAGEIARSQRLKHPFSLLMIDLDHFKDYNDTHGHLAGDGVLARVSAVFKDAIRNIDYAARYGGEEFCLLLHEVGLDGAVRAAERIRQRVAAEKFGSDDAPMQVTVSIGVAEFPVHGDTPEKIIGSADAALYDAKRTGRNRVVTAGSRTEAT